MLFNIHQGVGENVTRNDVEFLNCPICKGGIDCPKHFMGWWDEDKDRGVYLDDSVKEIDPDITGIYRVEGGYRMYLEGDDGKDN